MADDDVIIIEGGGPIDWLQVLADKYGNEPVDKFESSCFFLHRLEKMLEDVKIQPLMDWKVESKQCFILGSPFDSDEGFLMDDLTDVVGLEYLHQMLHIVQRCS